LHSLQFPNLQFSYWDGNGFTGTLPASVGKLRNLSRISFNINQLSGEMPPSWADVKVSRLQSIAVKYSIDVKVSRLYHRLKV
jgi:hypothetical protein